MIGGGKPANGRRARTALLGGVFALLLIQGGGNVVLEIGRPSVGDPEYEARLRSARQLCSAHADQPFAVALGSSRTLMGLAPAAMDSEPSCVLMNFAHSGAGPLTELLYFRRLLRDGVKPTHVFIEIMPALLGMEGPPQFLVPLQRLGRRDVAILAEYAPKPVRVWQEWVKQRLIPGYPFRLALDQTGLPNWFRVDRVWEMYAKDLDRFGWRKSPIEEESAAQRQRALTRTTATWGRAFDSYRIAPTQSRALCDLLRLCRMEGIAATLYLMPEASYFRAYYTPAAEAALDHYLAGLTEEFGVPVADCRTWMPDDFDFADPQHLLPRGARSFSRRFGTEVVVPRLRGTFAQEPTP